MTINIKKYRAAGMLALSLLILVAILITIGIGKAHAESSDLTYRLGSTGDITYKENENKVYYTRKHFSSGSGIKYYTRLFVISLKEVSESDDISRIDETGDYKLELLVASDGRSVKESEADKTKSFYWYDSDYADDDGYITTTYVIDGSLLLNLLDEAAAVGKYGKLYIHHVFAVTGGSNDDSWHRTYHVTNDVPYYTYSSLFTLKWNNTEATHASQEACMNIPVPFKSFCDVYTAYYNEEGVVVRQEKGRLTGNAVWNKTVPYIITDRLGRKYVSVAPGTRKDITGNTMKALYIYNTDPLNKSFFPAWNLNRDLDHVNGSDIRAEDAAALNHIQGGYKERQDNIYTFPGLKSGIFDVILYVPVTLYDEDAGGAGTTPGPDVTPTPDITSGLTPDPDTTPFPDPDITPFPDPDITPVLTPAIDDPAFYDASVFVRYFHYDHYSGNITLLKTEMKTNPDSRNGHFGYNDSYSIGIDSTIYKDGRMYEPDMLDGILYGDNASIMVSGQLDYIAAINLSDQGVYGYVQGSLNRGTETSVDFETADSGGYYTVFILCREMTAQNTLVLKYIDTESGDVINEKIENDYFNGASLFWHGINGELSWALPVRIESEIETEDGLCYIPAFVQEGAATTHTGACTGSERTHDYYGFGSGNAVTRYCETCGKVRRITYYDRSPYEPDAITSVYDNNSYRDAYHSYRIFDRDTCGDVRADLVAENAYATQNRVFSTSYNGCSSYEYDYDPDSKRLWLRIPGSPDSGHRSITFDPQKDTGYGAGVIYIPCVLSEKRKPIKIRIVNDNLKYVQYHYTNTDIPQLVTGYDATPFSLLIDEYGDDVMVSFGMDVETSDGIRLKADTWNILYPGYFLPSDVSEGIYTVSAAVFGTDGKITDIDETELEISGRLYGLTLYNVNSENPEWRDVFDLGDENKYKGYNMYAGTDVYNEEKNDTDIRKHHDGTFDDGFTDESLYYYSVGLNDENGIAVADTDGNNRLQKYTLPLMDGASPVALNSGMLKSGYTWSFCIKTRGSRMEEEHSEIIITPVFYHIGTDGTKQQVDIWYQGTGKSGGNYIKLSGSVKAKSIFDISGNNDTGTNAVISTTGTTGEKTWLFNYSLPDTWYCCRFGFDMDGYLDKYDGCTFEEDFWEKDGYLAVNFQIEAKDASGNVIMTYSNLSENIQLGMCDMWETEGYDPEKTDCYGNTFPLQEGDVILVRIPGSTIKRGSGIPDPPTNLSEDTFIKTGSYPYLSFPR
ncbi:MAG: hypothetical protein IK007_05700 [Lachnospiraceae bacterium]|nr:hypothetical protein [Lachnospiraceae bacterium]